MVDPEDKQALVSLFDKNREKDKSLPLYRTNPEERFIKPIKFTFQNIQ